MRKDWRVVVLKGIILLYFVLINFYGYVVMALDKNRAIQHRQRISEHHLWVTSWIGGALGVLMAMRRRHHKTKHLSFRLGVPILCLLDVVILVVSLL